ncbi:MAG: hypothetical protein K8L99_20485 [Anaerolineae bacterium]|nr:hypothetical protein [Anaerolineae bacterium]
MTMLFVALLSLLPAFAFSQPTQVDAGSLAAQASSAYEAGDYTNAISLYRALLDGGIRDSRVYFNLGNAYYQSDNIGFALLNYRRAQQLSPRDGEIYQRLNLARSRRLDIQGDETLWLDAMSTFTLAVVTCHELGWIVLTLWFVFFACLIAWILLRTQRNVLRPILFATGLFLIVGLSLWLVRGFTEANRPAAVVVENTATVMSGPGEDYLELYRLYGGAEMRLLEVRDGWVRFMLPDQRQGWIPQSTVEQV